MKHVGLIGGCFGLILLLTGCGNTKTLTCTMNEESSYAKGIMGYQITYKNDALSKVEQKFSVEVTDEDYVDYLDSLEEEYNDEVNEYQSDGIKYNLERNGNNLILGVTYNLGKMTKDELDEIGFYEEDDNSYENVKSELEDEGYTCK